eukprot:scaffold17691_cov99-Isochrysis_galbana.AAC.3
MQRADAARAAAMRAYGCCARVVIVMSAGAWRRRILAPEPERFADRLFEGARHRPYKDRFGERRSPRKLDFVFPG